MSERWMADVVRESDRLNEVFVEPQAPCDGAADLRHFERVRQAGAMMIVDLSDENLRLADHAAEGGAVDDAFAIALEEGSKRVRLLGIAPSAAQSIPHCIRREPNVFVFGPFHRRSLHPICGTSCQLVRRRSGQVGNLSHRKQCYSASLVS